MQKNPSRNPVHPGLAEADIHRLVHRFYDQVRNDPQLGPIFERAIGDDWAPHLAKMCDFWSSVMLMTGRYSGAPMVAHMRLKMVRPEHFARWLALFGAAAAELFPPDIAGLFVARAENIARSLQLGMFFRPGESGRAAGP